MAEKPARTQVLRTLPDTELTAKLQSLRREVWDGRMKAKGGALRQPHRLRQAKRQIARILTVLRGRAPRDGGGQAPTDGGVRHG